MICCGVSNTRLQAACTQFCQVNVPGAVLPAEGRLARSCRTRWPAADRTRPGRRAAPQDRNSARMRSATASFSSIAPPSAAPSGVSPPAAAISSSPSAPRASAPSAFVAAAEARLCCRYGGAGGGLAADAAGSRSQARSSGTMLTAFAAAAVCRHSAVGRRSRPALRQRVHAPTQGQNSRAPQTGPVKLHAADKLHGQLAHGVKGRPPCRTSRGCVLDCDRSQASGSPPRMKSRHTKRKE